MLPCAAASAADAPDQMQNDLSSVDRCAKLAAVAPRRSARLAKSRAKSRARARRPEMKTRKDATGAGRSAPGGALIAAAICPSVRLSHAPGSKAASFKAAVKAVEH